MFEQTDSNKLATIRAESENPWMIFYQDTTMLARYDSFVLVSGISEANVDLLAGGVVAIHDAAVETVVSFWIPSCIVIAERVLSGCRQMALKSAETFLFQKATAVAARFIAQRYYPPFLEHA